MNLILKTHRFLLRSRFKRTRGYLSGEQQVGSSARLGEVLLYDSSQADNSGKNHVGRERKFRYPVLETVMLAKKPAEEILPEAFELVTNQEDAVSFPKITAHIQTPPEITASTISQSTQSSPTSTDDQNTREAVLQKARKISRFTKIRNRGSVQKRRSMRGRKTSNRVVGWFLTAITIVSLIFALVLFVPAVYYIFFPADVIEIKPSYLGSPLGGEFAPPGSSSPEGAVAGVTSDTPAPTPEPYTPPRDETLPEGDWLVIPRIGVRTPLRKTTNPDEALDKGVWHVPDFGTPGDRTQPMILAAHRFGWQWWWKDEYWRYNSFYNLPETEPGDIIEVISDKRKWTYEIYAGEEGEDITDYNADLILYTCKYLQSPVRHFRYARIIDPTVMTQ